MLITQVVVGNILYPLVEGQPFPINVGETLRVSFAFKYLMPEDTEIRIWSSLYYYTPLGLFNREDRAQTKGVILLEKAEEWKDFTGEIDILIGQAPSGIYGLIVELPDYGEEAEHRIETCIQVIGVASIFDMIGPLLILGLLAGIMPMLGEGAE